MSEVTNKIASWWQLLRRPRFTTWTHILAVYATVTMAVTLLNGFSTGLIVDYHVVRPFEFWLREALGMTPKLDPRIKIIAYDDNTVSRYSTTDIKMEEWATLFARLDDRKPSVILIDKLFDLPRGKKKLQSASADYISGIKSRIIPGTFVTKVDIRKRKEIKRFNDRNRLNRLNRDEGGFDWLPIKDGGIYGAAPHILHSFDEFGHLVYWGDGRVEPFIRFSEENGVFHLALLASENLYIKDDKFWAEDNPIPTDRQGQVHVNMVPKEDLQKVSWSFYSSLEAAYGTLKKGEGVIDKIEFVNEGDYVFILPAMFTGSGDWVSTPVGVIQGGYVQASVLNSMLTNKWLAPLNLHWVLPAVTVAIATIIAASFWGSAFWIAFSLMIVTMVLVGLSSFVFLSTIVSWLLPTMGAAAGALILFGIRTAAARLEQVRIENELQTTALVQKTFFPQAEPDVEHIMVRGRYIPASECSGDWWGHFTTPDGVPYVIVGDAMGHGTPAALVTGMAYTSCNSYYQLAEQIGVETFSPAAVLNHFNKILHNAMGGSFFMTMYVMAFDFAKGEIIMANAGHVSPILVPANPEDERIKRKSKSLAKISPLSPINLRVPGSPLGENVETNYKDKRMPMMPGDKIFTYTDALVECAGTDGTIWTPKELTKKLLTHAELPGEEFTANFRADVDAHFGKRELEDDQTIVIVEISREWKKDTVTKESA